MPVPSCCICGKQMQLLFMSFFCPNDCDRKHKDIREDESILILNTSGSWRVKKLKITETIPSWATRGWFLFLDSIVRVEQSDLPMKDWLIAAKDYWDHHKSPGWPLESEPKPSRSEASHIIVMAK